MHSDSEEDVVRPNICIDDVSQVHLPQGTAPSACYLQDAYQLSFVHSQESPLVLASTSLVQAEQLTGKVPCGSFVSVQTLQGNTATSSAPLMRLP